MINSSSLKEEFSEEHLERASVVASRILFTYIANV